MATVFLARAEGLGGFERDVAVKLLHEHLRENADLASQLINEARISAKIRHPNVVQVHDVGEDPSGIFLVMEYVEGDTLSGLQRAARAAGETVPIPIALRILSDALAGLHSAHELRDGADQPLEIVHRDFSPQNILVGTDGISRLTDFGIAKAASRTDGQTRPGLIKGKIGYMAPEQARGKSVDRRCDVWAAGVIAWELLAGRPLRGNDDEVATLLEVVSTDPPDVRTACPTISDAVATAVASALIGRRDQRCPTADQLRHRLTEAWRAQGGSLADNAEVAAYVRRFGRGLEEPNLQRRRAPSFEFVHTESFDGGSPAKTPNTATLPSLAFPALPPGAVTDSTMIAVAARRSSGSIAGRGGLLLLGAALAGGLLLSSGLISTGPSQKNLGESLSATSPSAAPVPTPEPSAPRRVVVSATAVMPAGTPSGTMLASTSGDRDRRLNVVARAAGKPAPSRSTSARHDARLEPRPVRAKSKVSRHRLASRLTSASTSGAAAPAGKSPPPLAGNPYAGQGD